MHEMQSFAPYPRDRWERLKAAVQAEFGIALLSDKGIGEGHGVKLSYEYDEAAQTVMLQTLDKPLFLSEAVLDQKIHEFVESCQ